MQVGFSKKSGWVKIICILGGLAKSVIELKALADVITYTKAQCQVTEYTYP
jgi:hypothetical protein